MTLLSSIGTHELQLLFGALSDAVLITDRNAKVVFLNPAAQHLTRHTQQEAEDQPLAAILPLGAGGGPLDSPAAACLREGRPIAAFVARLENERRAGRAVEVSAAPVQSSDGTPDGAIVIVRDVTRARLEARRLAHRATHDPLTGLVNRAEFNRRLRRAFAGGAARGTEHVLGFLDLDGFKRINDSCGHLSGDELLRQLSTLIQSRMRARDTVARLGGDEFGILLEHCTPARGARIADDLQQAISGHPLVCNGQTHRVGVSIGLVWLHRVSSPVEALRLADAACYQAKREGGNRVRVHPS